MVDVLPFAPSPLFEAYTLCWFAQQVGNPFLAFLYGRGRSGQVGALRIPELGRISKDFGEFARCLRK